MNVKILLSAAFIATTFSATAQDASFAITGNGTRDFNWTNIRQVNVKTGTVDKVIYNNQATDAAKAAQVIVDKYGVAHTAMGYGVAAAAYDKAHNRLYFTQMHLGDLNYVDLNKGASITIMAAELMQRNGGMFLTEESHITRMVIAPDGTGYAVTNDGNHLISFTTGKKPEVKDLGAIVDADTKNGISIHNKCSSWGGDMIADAYGKLYIISANHQVFKLDAETKIATHLGKISGLPGNYTTNGAAVEEDGNIVVSSAQGFAGYYKFALSDLKASKIEGSDADLSSSDLANGNYLLQKEYDAERAFVKNPTSFTSDILTSGNGRVYPNPVTARQFNVSFDKMAAGAYKVSVSDLSGRDFQVNSVNVNKGQVVNIKLTKAMAKGTYLVKVIDAANQVVITERIVIQ